MRKLHAALLTAGGLVFAAGVAQAAAKLNTMNVALPDGSVAQIQYQGDVAPRVRVVPVEAYDPFAEMERMSALMQARHEAIMRQAAEAQQRIRQQVKAAQVRAAQQGRGAQPGQIVVSTNAPAGSYRYTMVTTTTSGNGCTQTVEYRSDGTGAEPKVTQASSGDCSAVQKNAPAVPAATPVQGQSRLPSRTS